MSPAYRLLLRWSRNLHIYLTLFGLVLLTFFAVTGFMLNHADWFHLSEPIERKATGTVPVELLDPLNELAVVERLRKDHAITDPLDFLESVNVGDDPGFKASFTGPGRVTEAEIKGHNEQVDDGVTKVVFKTRHLAKLLTDLHQGHPDTTGREWGLVIDALAILVLLVSVTGLVLWWSLHSRGRFGFLTILLGAGACLAMYFIYVP